MKKSISLLLAACLVATTSFANPLKDLTSKKNRDKLKTAATVVAVVAAAKLIADMVIEHRSKNVSKEDKVAKEYKEKHQELPEQPTATRYVTETDPGKVVEVGKKVVIRSDIVVVPGSKTKQAVIEERIVIYDNEDNTKPLNTLTKPVNGKTKKAGHYQNEFSFTLPEGLPQGVYPIKTELLINGQAVESASNDIQLVMIYDAQGQQQLLALAY